MCTWWVVFDITQASNDRLSVRAKELVMRKKEKGARRDEKNVGLDRNAVQIHVLMAD